MIAVVGAIALVTTLVGAALAATNGDLSLTRRDLDTKRAYAAAQAGIADYSFHLNNDNDYWARCTSVPAPHAVNQVGSTSQKRLVPGSTDTSYAIELLPATGQSSCSTGNPVLTMLEASGPNTGSFRIRSTGFAPGVDRSIVATFKRASLLDYIYFTQLETSDPVTYGFANPSAALTGAYSQCSKFIREGRYSQSIPGTSGQFCNKIVFVSRRQHQRSPAHERCADDLRHSDLRAHGRRRDRGQLAAGRLDGRVRGHQPAQLRRPLRNHCAGADPTGDQRQAEDDRRPDLHPELPHQHHPERHEHDGASRHGHPLDLPVPHRRRLLRRQRQLRVLGQHLLGQLLAVHRAPIRLPRSAATWSCAAATRAS